MQERYYGFLCCLGLTSLVTTAKIVMFSESNAISSAPTTVRRRLTSKCEFPTSSHLPIWTRSSFTIAVLLRLRLFGLFSRLCCVMSVKRLFSCCILTQTFNYCTAHQFIPPHQQGHRPLPQQRFRSLFLFFYSLLCALLLDDNCAGRFCRYSRSAGSLDRPGTGNEIGMLA